MVEVDVKIEAGDLYDFMLMHAYNSPGGITGSAMGAVMLLFALMTGRWIFLFVGAAVLLYLPWSLFIKSRRQARSNPAFRQPLHYVLDEEGICISQEGLETKQPWTDMVKAVSTGRSIIVYTSRTDATIFPREQLGDKRSAVIGMISTHMPPSKVKIRS